MENKSHDGRMKLADLLCEPDYVTPNEQSSIRPAENDIPADKPNNTSIQSILNQTSHDSSNLPVAESSDVALGHLPPISSFFKSDGPAVQSRSTISNSNLSAYLSPLTIQTTASPSALNSLPSMPPNLQQTSFQTLSDRLPDQALSRQDQIMGRIGINTTQTLSREPTRPAAIQTTLSHHLRTDHQNYHPHPTGGFQGQSQYAYPNNVQHRQEFSSQRPSLSGQQVSNRRSSDDSEYRVMDTSRHRLPMLGQNDSGFVSGTMIGPDPHGPYRNISGAIPSSASFPSSSHSTFTAQPIPYVQPAEDMSTRKRRKRRRYDEIQRIYQCTWKGCQRSYGTLNHLNHHIVLQSHGPKRSAAEFRELRYRTNFPRLLQQQPNPHSADLHEHLDSKYEAESTSSVTSSPPPSLNTRSISAPSIRQLDATDPQVHSSTDQIPSEQEGAAAIIKLYHGNR